MNIAFNDFNDFKRLAGLLHGSYFDSARSSPPLSGNSACRAQTDLLQSSAKGVQGRRLALVARPVVLCELLGYILDGASAMYSYFPGTWFTSFKWKHIRRILSLCILGGTSSSVRVARRGTRGLWSVSATIDFPTM